jgi:hypothetical protein
MSRGIEAVAYKSGRLPGELYANVKLQEARFNENTTWAVAPLHCPVVVMPVKLSESRDLWADVSPGSETASLELVDVQLISSRT